MTFKELSNELGFNALKLERMRKAGLIKYGVVLPATRMEDEQVLVIRQCCLLSMLGIEEEEAFGIIKGEIDLKASLKKKIDEILSDDSNRSQAAIVMQNIRRECGGIEDFDPEQFILQIKELKSSGGLFYDVNTSRLENRPAAGPQEKQSFFKRLGESVKGVVVIRKEDGQDENTSRTPENGNDILKDGNGNESKTDDISKNISEDTADNNPEKITESPGDIPDDNRGDTPTDTAKDTEDAPFDEKWSPYSNRGFGASNMGSGNWHGWSPGYGTYSRPIGARERINNGEKTCPHPFRRFAARVVDTTIITVIISAVLRLGFRINIGMTLSSVMYLEIVFWFFEMLIEPLLLATIGTTPGKWIVGIKLRDMKTKSKLDLKQAYIRTLKLAWHGFGFMIPLYTLFKRVMSFAQCRLDDTMPWDVGIDVELTDEKPLRMILCLAAILMLNFSDELVSKQALLPSNRGNLTREQFDRNVAEVMKYTGYSGEFPKFKVEMQGSYVKSVSLHYDADDSSSNRYDEMYIGFLAFAGASESANGINLMLSQAVSKLKAYYVSFTDEYCSVAIRNETDNVVQTSSAYSRYLSQLYGMDVTITGYAQDFIMTKQNF